MADLNDLYDMSDEELEAAFKEARAEGAAIEDVEPLPEEEEDLTTEVEGEEEEEQEDLNTDDSDETSGAEDDADKQSESTTDNDGTEQLGDTQDSGPDVGGEAATQGEGDTNTDSAAKAPTVRKVKANGKEYEFTTEEMEAQFPKIFGQAMDYTKKMQAIAPWRKTIDAIEQAKLSHSDVNLMIDALKGDKNAISEVLKRTSVDALDLNPAESVYTPNDYGRDSRTLALQDVLESINQDAEYTVTSQILSKDWDDASWNVLSADPNKIRQLHNDVKDGTYAKVQRIAEKLKVFDGGRRSDLEYYLEGGREYFSTIAAQEAQSREAAILAERKSAEEAAAQRVAAAKAEEAKRKSEADIAKARKAAAPTSGRNTSVSGINYLDASDEDFEEWYKKTMDQ